MIHVIHHFLAESHHGLALGILAATLIVTCLAVAATLRPDVRAWRVGRYEAEPIPGDEPPNPSVTGV